MASRRGRAAAVRAPNGNSRAAGKAHERPRDKHATDTAKQLQRAQREHRKEGKQGRAQAVGVVRRWTRGERNAEWIGAFLSIREGQKIGRASCRERVGQ